MGDNITIDLKTTHRAELVALIRAAADDIEVSGNKWVGVTLAVKFYEDEKPKKKGAA